MCWRCREQNYKLKEVEDAFTGGKVSLWGVLESTICGHNWDRDVNAANNIRYLGLLEYGSLDRPEIFTRRTEDETNNLQSLLNLMDVNTMAPFDIAPVEVDNQVTSSL